MKIKVEFQKGIDEHELGEIVGMLYRYNEYYKEYPKVDFTDIYGKTVTYFMSEILTLLVEE